MQLVVGDMYEVTVSHIVNAGIVVKLSDNSTQLIHLSNISDQFVRSPADYVRPGDKYEAECICGFNGKVQLSLKHLKLRRRLSENEQFINAVDKIPVRPHNVKQADPRPTNMYHPKVRKELTTLDDMIADSNRAYQDKMRRSNKDRRRRK